MLRSQGKRQTRTNNASTVRRSAGTLRHIRMSTGSGVPHTLPLLPSYEAGPISVFILYRKLERRTSVFPPNPLAKVVKD